MPCAYRGFGGCFLKLIKNEQVETITGIRNLKPGIWESEDWLFFVSNNLSRDPFESCEDLPVHIIGWDQTNKRLATPSIRYWTNRTFKKSLASFTISN